VKHQHVKVAGVVCIAGALALTVTMVLAGSPNKEGHLLMSSPCQ
jgi:hypothetical protein